MASRSPVHSPLTRDVADELANHMKYKMAGDFVCRPAKGINKEESSNLRNYSQIQIGCESATGEAYIQKISAKSNMISF